MSARFTRGDDLLRYIKINFAFFVVSGFDIIDALDQMCVPKEEIIDWVYSMQISKKFQNDDLSLIGKWGFRGCFTNGVNHSHDFAHLAMTYSALAILLILGDDLERLDRDAIAKGIGEYQSSSGSFHSSLDNEFDMRFIFCASAICYIINDWSAINLEKLLYYIEFSLTYENGFSQTVISEAHGGSTYCAVASLKLTNTLHTFGEEKLNRVVEWCLRRQLTGFEGRPNKKPDTCYSFWVGAALDILGQYKFINYDKLERFCLNLQDESSGGFSKYYGATPDLMHTYLVISGLSLGPNKEFNSNRVVPELNISQKAFEHLKKIQQKWNA